MIDDEIEELNETPVVKKSHWPEDFDKSRCTPGVYRPEYVGRALEMKMRGYTNTQIADALHVSYRSFKNWQHKYPEFRDAIEQGREKSVEDVERSLYQSAMGYEYETVKIIKGKDDKIIRVPHKAYMPPNVIAQIFFLKNQNPERWNDRIALANLNDRHTPAVLEVTYVGEPKPKVEIPQDSPLLSAGEDVSEQ